MPQIESQKGIMGQIDPLVMSLLMFLMLQKWIAGKKTLWAKSCDEHWYYMRFSCI